MRARERGRREEPRARAAARQSGTLPLHAAGAGRGRVSPARGRWPAGVVLPGRRRGVPAAAPPLGAAPAGEPGAGGASRPACPPSASFSASALGRRRRPERFLLEPAQAERLREEEEELRGWAEALAGTAHGTPAKQRSEPA